MPVRLAITDDDELLAAALARYLRRTFEVTVFSRPLAFLAELRAGRTFDAVLFDFTMPEMTGGEVLRAVQAEFPALVPRCVLMTGQAAHELPAHVLHTLRDRILWKPFPPAAATTLLLAVIARAAAPERTEA